MCDLGPRGAMPPIPADPPAGAPAAEPQEEPGQPPPRPAGGGGGSAVVRGLCGAAGDPDGPAIPRPPAGSHHPHAHQLLPGSAVVGGVSAGDKVPPAMPAQATF